MRVEDVAPGFRAYTWGNKGYTGNTRGCIRGFACHKSKKSNRE